MTKLVVIIGFAVAFAAGLMVGRQSGRATSGNSSPATTKPSHRSLLVSELGLNTEQQQAMDKIWSEQAKRGRSEQDDHRRQIRRERDEAIAGLVHPEDYDKYDQILKNYNDQAAAMDREMRKNFELAVAKTKELLNPEQQAKYEDFLSRHQTDRGRDRGRERENPRRPDASATSRPTSQP